MQIILFTYACILNEKKKKMRAIVDTLTGVYLMANI